jgi:hypothetical protein
MKIKSLFFLSAVALVASCSKNDDKPKPETPTDPIVKCGYGMQANYHRLSPSEQYDTVPSIAPYVKDGVFKMASLPNVNVNYWTSIHFVDSSSCGLMNGLQVAGDTISLEVMLKNPTTGDGSLTANDIALYIAGEKDTAMVLVVSNAIHTASTSLKVGNNGITTGSSKLVAAYDNFTKLSLKANSGTLSLLANDTTVASTSYGSAQIGLVKDFRVTFLGTGSIDYIRVYGKSGKLLMSNEFTDVTAKWQGIQF